MAGSEVMSVLLPFISWSTLPQMISKLALRGLYDLQILARPTQPVQAQLHARRVQVLVILAYLVYTVYATIYQRSANFYELLGVSLDSDMEDVRKAFRKLARVYHPDKAGGRAQDEYHFIELRRAHDCLVDPMKRLAYDRFGPSILGHGKDVTTEREYFSTGLQSSLGFYIIHPISYGLVNWLAGRKVITFWLLTLYILLLASEVSLIFRGVHWNAFGFLPSTMTAHDLVASLHSAYTALILATTHLGPLLPTLRGGANANANANSTFNHLFDGATSEKDLLGLCGLIEQHETRSADLLVQSGRNMDMTLLPLRPKPIATTQTIQQAANEAARKRSNRKFTASNIRQPSTVEQTYIYKLSQSILQHRLEVIPAVREALKKRSKEHADATQQPSQPSTKSELIQAKITEQPSTKEEAKEPASSEKQTGEPVPPVKQ